MPNALTVPADPMPQGAPAQGNALQQGAPGNQPQPRLPAPTHAQTVAALRHFTAINRQLEALIKNPDLGKADIRKSVIDSVTKLVSQRIISPPQAVDQMSSFPDKPFDQKQWVTNMYAQNAAAKISVVMHHSAAYGGQPTYDASMPNPDDHIQDMASMMQTHFPGRQ